MSGINEIVITCDNNGSYWTCSAWDPRTETNYMIYKGGGAAATNTLTFIGDEYLLAANNAKPIIHIWPMNSQDQVSGARFIAPGKVSALTVSPDGYYLVAGIQESLHVWNVASGKMLAAISKHYQPIAIVKFTDDGTHFISAGQDGNILVWNLTAAVCTQLNKSQPLYAFNDHSLSVTDIHIGTGGIQAQLFSVSTDRTCRIYDLSDGTQLLTIVFPEALQSVVVNRAETVVYVGSSNGSIFDFSIVSPPRKREYHLTDAETSRKLVGHKGAITCLALSIDDDTLLSGGTDQNVCIWNIPSRQLLRTIPHKGTITNAVFRLIPIGRFRETTDKQPARFVVANNIKRMMETGDDENDIIEIMVTERINVKSSSINGNSSRSDSVSKPTEVSEDVADLQAKVQRLEKANKELFEFCAKNLLTKK